MISTSGMLKAQQRYGEAYRKRRQWLTAYDSWSLEAKLNHQATTLSNFIEFAKDKSSFYGKLYLGINTHKIKQQGDLSALPTVDKEMLRSNIQDVYTIRKYKAVEAQTGGTTGKPLIVRYTLRDMMHRMALLDHFKSRHGFENRKMVKATFSGKPIIPPKQKSDVFWRYNRAARQMLYSTFHLSEENLPHYIKHLNELKPKALDGFISSLSEVANYMERFDVKLQFQPIGIFPTAEAVTPNQRALLQRVFKCKVYDQYASSEGAPFITECSHASLHIELTSGVFEQLPESDEVLVTSFQTHGTPLIRYRIGDSMKLNSDGICGCGVTGPLVSSIQGRAGDYLWRTDGAKVNIVHVANMFKALPNVILKAQVIQRAVGQLEILLVAEDLTANDEIEKLLQDEVLNTFGTGTIASVYFVEEIRPAPSGKHRLVRNMVHDEHP